MRSTQAILQNQASRQYFFIYRGIKGLEALLRLQLSPEHLQQIPPLPQVNPKLEHPTNKEAYAQEESEEEAEGVAEKEDTGDLEASKEDQIRGVFFFSFPF